MNITEIRETLKTEDYSFLTSNEHLGNNVIMITLGGSHAYGTNIESSDLDIRGCALNSKLDLLTRHNFEQFVDTKTDTTIYSFNKLISLLCNANPNVIEMLGNKKEHYLYLHPIGKELIDNAHMFLSKKAIYSFGGYANQQRRKLENKSIRTIDQNKLSKHMMHLIRLYLMCIDIFEKEQIITYREENKELLMAIREGIFLDKDNKPNIGFYTMLDSFERRLNYAKESTSLPEEPNYKLIDEFVMSINERVVRNEF